MMLYSCASWKRLLSVEIGQKGRKRGRREEEAHGVYSIAT